MKYKIRDSVTVKELKKYFEYTTGGCIHYKIEQRIYMAFDINDNWEFTGVEMQKLCLPNEYEESLNKAIKKLLDLKIIKLESM